MPTWTPRRWASRRTPSRRSTVALVGAPGRAASAEPRALVIVHEFERTFLQLHDRHVGRLLRLPYRPTPKLPT
jgi:hypothetical protein